MYGAWHAMVAAPGMRASARPCPRAGLARACRRVGALVSNERPIEGAAGGTTHEPPRECRMAGAVGAAGPRAPRPARPALADRREQRRGRAGEPVGLRDFAG